ncbi:MULTISPECIES: cytochrome P450 [Edaphosphingomonas]|uniref:Cytochrome P450 n=2 Tax=Edaphosphingomonas TaxID=3423724 RepID=A0A2T4HYK6_9SPHN|nr:MULTISPECIES: cytochrome P450 [Sphingomonas]MDX3884758.1 cytochrome P450 [Sphingomonas sp.]OHT19520.1 Epi-isozizaene 5-monooxygenase/(E)-beta-farnesene synthase [Sphingomonas haloaromaticamans]PTD21166.1 cytochrome P450 [Sphingomonas fennica]
MATVLEKPTNDASPAPRARPASEIPVVPGIPFLGNTLEMAKDPAAFFVRCYREHGPVFRIKVFGRESIVIAGPESATFMTTREGRDALRSKEFWEGLIKEYGATETITSTDGERHIKLRTLMREGFSREAVQGQYDNLRDITDRAIGRRWDVGTDIPVVEAMQYMVVEQLGMLLTGQAPLEYVKDIRFAILTILNVLVTRQRPKIMLHDPRFRKARRRVEELGHTMIADFQRKVADGTAPKNLITDIIRANLDDKDIMPDQNLILTVTGPYVAGLDTAANTMAACIYGVLKNPEVLARVQAEADELFAKETLNEDDIRKLPVINGAVMEAMRLWPIAVAQMRVANFDFEYAGYTIPKDEMIYIGTSVPHFMEEFFPDVNKFDVDRYQRPRAEHLQKGAYSPFGRGPHSCLGQGLAEVLMAMSIARIFHRLDLALPHPNYELKTKTAPTPGPAMDFAVKVIGERRPSGI